MNPNARVLAATAVAVASIGWVATAGSGLGGQALAASASDVSQITTVAGGIGGPGPARAIAAPPCDVVVAGGHVLFTDANGLLRQLDPRTGALTTLAGDGDGACGLAANRAGDVALAEEDRMRLIAARTGTLFGQAMTRGHIYTVASKPVAVFGVPAFDHAGNLVIADAVHGQVLVVAARSGTFYGQTMTAGGSYAIAGSGGVGFSGDGGPATGALLNGPLGVAFDPAGNVLIADAENYRVRLVAESSGTFYGIKMTAGDIYTIAGQHVGGYYGDGGPATRAALCRPQALALDSAGNVLVADTCNNRIRVVAARSGVFYERAMKTGDIYSIASGPAGRDGGPAGRAGMAPDGLAVDGSGNVVVADSGQLRLRAIAERTGRFYGRPMVTGHIYDVAGNGQQSISGNGGPGTRAELGEVQGIANGPLGVYVDAREDFPPQWAVRLLATKSGEFFGQKMIRGDIYAIAGEGAGSFKVGGPANRALDFPGIGADAHGNALIADQQTNRVWVVAARSGTFYGQRMKAGRGYPIAGTGVLGNSGNGGWPAKARLEGPAGVTVDRFGDVVITENGELLPPPTYRFFCRVLLIAGRTGRFYGIAMKAGHIYQVAGSGHQGDGPDGGPALRVAINVSDGTVDQAGNLLLAEWANNKVRVVARTSGTYYGQAMTAGHLYAMAGDGTNGFAGDGGRAGLAELAGPNAVAVDAVGNVLITDSDNNRIRVVPARTGTFYGVPMTAGHIYTISGDGTRGFSGDGGPALKAELNSPRGIAAATGGVLIADNSRLRLISG